MDKDEAVGLANQDEIGKWWNTLAEVDRVRWLVAWQGRSPDDAIEPEQELLDTLPAVAVKPPAEEPYRPNAELVAFLDGRVAEFGE